MTNKAHSVLYTGVTTNIETRVEQHRAGLGSAFTRKYKCHKLVYYEEFEDVRVAIAREKQIKAGKREDKLALIKKMNPEWRDLSEAWRRADEEIATSVRPEQSAHPNQDRVGGPSSQ